MKLIFLLAVSLTSGCSFFMTRSDLDSVSIMADANANNNMAAAVDLVLVTNKQLANSLPKNSLVWFSERDTWLDNNPGSLQSILVEVPPRKELKKVPIPFRLFGYYQVNAYIKYFDKNGQNRIDLSNYDDAYITLSNDKVTYGEIESIWSFFQ